MQIKKLLKFLKELSKILKSSNSCFNLHQTTIKFNQRYLSLIITFLEVFMQGIKINEKLIKYNFSKRTQGRIQYIVIHDTGNIREGADATITLIYIILQIDELLHIIL